MEEKIFKMGNSFRGLWKSYEMNFNDDNLKEGWTVTFIYNGQYVETPTYSNADQALDFAIKKLG